MYRITVEQRAGRCVVILAGRLAGPDAGELDRLGRTLRAPVDLDVGELTAADDAGIAVLRRLRGDGFELRRVSPYIALLLGPEEGA